MGLNITSELLSVPIVKFASPKEIAEEIKRLDHLDETIMELHVKLRRVDEERDKKIAEIKQKIREKQNECPHYVTDFHPGAVTGDSYTDCQLCRKEL